MLWSTHGNISLWCREGREEAGKVMVVVMSGRKTGYKWQGQRSRKQNGGGGCREGESRTMVAVVVVVS